MYLYCSEKKKILRCAVIYSIKRKKSLSNNVFDYHYHNNKENTLQFIENFFLYYKSITNVTVCPNVSSISKFNDLFTIFCYRVCSINIIRDLYKLSMTFESNK